MRALTGALLDYSPSMVSVPLVSNAWCLPGSVNKWRALTFHAPRFMLTLSSSLVEILKEGKIVHAEPNDHDSMFGHPSYKARAGLPLAAPPQTRILSLAGLPWPASPSSVKAARLL